MKNNYSDLIHDIAYNNDASHIANDFSTQVFLPEDKEEIIEIVKQAIKENKKVICRWAGTNLVGNCLPIKDCFVLDVSKLDKIIEQKDQWVKVQPGVIWDVLNEYLAPEHLFFPVVLGSHTAAQIGAMISTNGAGMRAIKYGKMEHRVEELEVLLVNAKKEIEVKYIIWDQLQDFLWSEWMLGIVLEVKLKIIPKPTARSIDFLDFDNLEEALSKVEEVKNQQNPELSALEIINPKVAKLLDLENKYYVLAEYENSTTWNIQDKAIIEDLRSKRDACYSVVVNAWYDQIEDPHIIWISWQKEFIERFEKNNIPMFGHIGTGILHPHFKQDEKKLVDQMYQLVQKLWWKVSWEHGIGIKKKKYLSEQEKSEFRKLKTNYDPNNIFGGNSIL